MISFNCPTCSRSYQFTVDAAGKRGKCTECGEHLVVPYPPEPEWLPEPPSVREVRQPVASPPSPPAPPSHAAPPPSVHHPSDEEPLAYGLVERLSFALSMANRCGGALGILACVCLAAVVASNRNWSLAVGLLVMAVGCGVAMVGTELSCQLALVAVDMARNLRAVREEAGSGGGDKNLPA